LDLRERRKLQNEKLHKYYSSPNIIRLNQKEDEVGGAHNTKGGDENYIQKFSIENFA
jgi:hypothetical protein